MQAQWKEKLYLGKKISSITLFIPFFSFASMILFLRLQFASYGVLQ